MKTVRWSVLLAVLGASVQSANAADSLTLDVSLGHVPPEIRLETPSLWVGGALRGIVPATLHIEADTTTRLKIYGGDFGFSGTLKRQDQSVTVEPGPNSHCKPYKGEWKVSQTGDHVAIVLDIRKAGDWDCVEQSSIGAPDGRGKLKFATLPEGGILYYPKTSRGFLVQPTPVTLVVDFKARTPATVVFKKPGHYDCTVPLSFESESGAYFVSANGVRLGAMTENTVNAPAITCTLKPAPKGTLANPGK